MPTVQQRNLIVLGGNVIPWYRAGDAPLPVAAYQAKGAADLASSYVNLANPGTYNAAPGTAPTFAAATGWTFDGLTQWLTTGIAGAANMTVLVRFAGASGVNRCILGSRDGVGSGLYMMVRNGADTHHQYRCGTTSASVVPALDAGVMAQAGTRGYLNGTEEATTLDNSVASALVMYIGVLNNNGSRTWFHNGTIAAVAIYSSVLTAPQLAAVSAAMALL